MIPDLREGAIYLRERRRSDWLITGDLIPSTTHSIQPTVDRSICERDETFQSLMNISNEPPFALIASENIGIKPKMDIDRLKFEANVFLARRFRKMIGNANA